MLEFSQGKGNPTLVLVDPTFGNLTQRQGIEVMKLFSSMPENDNQVRALQPPKMLGHGLACHDQMLAQFAEGLPIAVVQLIEQLSPARVGQRSKDFIHRRPKFMQPYGCMSSAACHMQLTHSTRCARSGRLKLPFQIKRPRSKIDDAVMLTQDFRAEQPGNGW